MKVRIVCYEDVDGWILGKFALKLRENLCNMGIDTDIAKKPDSSADINHHIIFLDYEGKKNSIDTLMITHVDNIDKLELLKKQLQTAEAAICMSKESVINLSQLGLERNKLCYINPAHDGVVSVKKIVVGIASRVHDDGRKREYFFDRLAGDIDCRYFKFKIMGSGWEPQVASLLKNGFEVEYTDRFIYDEYITMIPTLDYYLYMGMDEGQMGFIDALAAGVKTIVTAQGYHLDALGGVVHPFTSYEEMKNIFLSLQEEKEKLVMSVNTWNWADYAKKHVEIWNYLLSRKPVEGKFTDGLNSLLAQNDIPIDYDSAFVKNKIRELKWNKYSHSYFKKKDQLKKAYNAKGLNGVLKLVGTKVTNRLIPYNISGKKKK
ncbi:hypothetical protein [Flavisolibacter tropicus]|uniref:Uncharacterized protein n=1 Tax=Flavisolibacter tropicus TaxID=1492898 RepID=A0A172TSF1_9BACT|nr:hypothetical protein [Flavisolibacter tropicus]ANE50015.1 hypothetical protein SY85_05405 [Flavisolibacter tropicus]